MPDRPPDPRGPRLGELGLRIGELEHGPTDSIADVPGVTVGHVTVWRDEPDPPEGRGIARTGVTAIGTTWQTYTVTVPATSPVAGRSFPLRVRFGLPITGGSLVVEARSGKRAWVQIGHAIPRDGLATARVVFPMAGTIEARACWSGSGWYGSATSAVVKIVVLR